MKPLRLLLLAALLAAPDFSRAEENRYDLLSRLLLPFAHVFTKEAKTPNRALRLAARLERLTDLPPALVGSRAEIAVQYPDKFRLRAPVFGEELTICRRGREVWVWPGAKAAELLEAARAAGKLPRADPKAQFAPFELPVPEKQLALVSMFFQVKDAGAESLDGESCRVLDLSLMPELAQSLRKKDWAARVWVRGDGLPARLSVARTGWQMAVRFERLEFSKTLPPETWQPTAEQAGDILRLDAGRYGQLIEAITR